VSPFRIGLVALHVFRESVRDRVLYAIAAFAVMLVAASILIGQITAGQDVKIIKDLGLATIELAGIVMSVFVGIGLVSREIDRRSIFALLAKPLRRSEFVAGKYAGLVLTITVNIAAMTIALYLMLAFLNWRALPDQRLAWDAPAADPRLLVAVALIALEMALLTAVALFFSTFTSSALLSLLFTLGVFIAGCFAGDLRHFGDIVDVTPAMGALVGTVGWVLPAFSAFDVKAQVVHGIAVPATFVLWTAVYALAYVAGLLAAAIAVFSRRDFQ
jgi:ABC-type transport system involved in multi-copper enzyme maturation permease subunit